MSEKLPPKGSPEEMINMLLKTLEYKMANKTLGQPYSLINDAKELSLKLKHERNTRQPDTELVDAIRNLTKSILDNVTLEYMDEMTEGKMTIAIDALLNVKD